MSYDVTQIYNLVNDSVKDALGKSATITALDSTGLVSLGKQISSFNAHEGFFNALTKRIAKTVYFVRSYTGRGRSILRSEEEYGAFVQKVYYELPEAVANTEWDVPNSSGQYKQHSPYDIEGTITVSALIFGGKGTWSLELIRPTSQIKEAFVSVSEMMRFIDGIYVQIENAYNLEVESLVALAANTAIADDLTAGKSRNLLSEYNTIAGTSLTADNCIYSADFIKYANMEVNRAIKNMAVMSTAYNKAGYATFTDSDNLVVEVLNQYAAASKSFLESDTFHKELVALPGYTEVPFWQYSGKSFAFSDCSTIKIEHDDVNGGETVTQSGIIAFVHDIENVAAYFGDRDTWEMLNPRDKVMIHGEHATKGYAVDGHANSIVFYVA